MLPRSLAKNSILSFTAKKKWIKAPFQIQQQSWLWRAEENNNFQHILIVLLTWIMQPAK